MKSLLWILLFHLWTCLLSHVLHHVLNSSLQAFLYFLSIQHVILLLLLYFFYLLLVQDRSSHDFFIFCLKIFAKPFGIIPDLVVFYSDFFNLFLEFLIMFLFLSYKFFKSTFITLILFDLICQFLNLLFILFFSLFGITFRLQLLLHLFIQFLNSSFGIIMFGLLNFNLIF